MVAGQRHRPVEQDLISHNGAGKTTLFNLIVGIYKPDNGKIRFDGKEVQDLPSHEMARLGIAKELGTLCCTV